MEVRSSGIEVQSNGMEVRSSGIEVRSSGTQIRSNGMQVAIRLHFCPECPSISWFLLRRRRNQLLAGYPLIDHRREPIKMRE